MQLPLCVAGQGPVALKEVARRHLQKKAQVLAVESLGTAQIAVPGTHPLTPLQSYWRGFRRNIDIIRGPETFELC